MTPELCDLLLTQVTLVLFGLVMVELRKQEALDSLLERQKTFLKCFEKEASTQLVGDKFAALFTYLTLKQKKKDGQLSTVKRGYALPRLAMIHYREVSKYM